MEKKYSAYMDEITAEDLYEGLLGYGMFANKLLPIFTSVPFYTYCQVNNPHFSNTWHDYVNFSSMRNINIPKCQRDSICPSGMQWHGHEGMRDLEKQRLFRGTVQTSTLLFRSLEPGRSIREHRSGRYGRG